MSNCLFENQKEAVELISEKVAEKLLAMISNDKELKEELQRRMDLNKRLNTNDLADYFGVTRQTVYNWNEQAMICTKRDRFLIKLGNKTLYDPIPMEKLIWDLPIGFKKQVNYFHYNEGILDDEQEVKKWEARIAVKEKYGLELTEHEIKFKEAFKAKAKDKTQKPDVYSVK